MRPVYAHCDINNIWDSDSDINIKNKLGESFSSGDHLILFCMNLWFGTGDTVSNFQGNCEILNAGIFVPGSCLVY